MITPNNNMHSQENIQPQVNNPVKKKDPAKPLSPESPSLPQKVDSRAKTVFINDIESGAYLYIPPNLPKAKLLTADSRAATLTTKELEEQGKLTNNPAKENLPDELPSGSPPLHRRASSRANTVLIKDLPPSPLPPPMPKFLSSDSRAATLTTKELEELHKRYSADSSGSAGAGSSSSSASSSSAGSSSSSSSSAGSRDYSPSPMEIDYESPPDKENRIDWMDTSE